MNDGGGPGGDPAPDGGGSPSPTPGAPAAAASSANPQIHFPEPEELGEEPAQPRQPQGAFYKRGERSFKDQKELDAYLDEMERGGGRQNDFDPARFREEIMADIERRYVRGEDDDDQRAGGKGGKGQGQQQEFTREQNPFDQETQPGQWAEHEVAQATAALEHKYGRAFEDLEERLGGLMSAHEQAEMRREYKGAFSEIVRDPRIQRDLMPGMEPLLEHIVGIDPRTKNDYSNLPALTSWWARKLKGWHDGLATQDRGQVAEKGKDPVPSVTRGAAAPFTRKPPVKVDNPGSLDGKFSMHSRLSRRFAQRRQE